VARRNFKRQTASLRAFLQTGVLGPISFDLALLDIADLLGPPSWWTTDARDYPFPLDWGYSDLGISFSSEPPHRIASLKINPAEVDGTQFHDLCPLLRLSLDDLPIHDRPSAMLGSGIWDLDSAEIGIHPDCSDPKLSINVVGIELLYVVLDSEAEKFAALQQGEEIDRAAALLDENATLHGIYAFPGRAGSQNRWPNERWHTVSAPDYLRATA
jgi:hypothetical protein